MPRRSAQGSGSPDGGSVGIMDTGSGTAGESLDLRPSASLSPENVNVFVQGVSDSTPGLRLASLGGRTLGGAIVLSVQAWVRNLAYDKEVWVDVRLLGANDEVLHAETLALQYQEPAEGGGDFFSVGAAVPTARTGVEVPAASRLEYRLCSQMNGQLFTDGILHRHEVTPGTPAPGTTAGTAAKPAAKKTAAKAATAKVPARAASGEKPAAAPRPRKPKTPKA